MNGTRTAGRWGMVVLLGTACARDVTQLEVAGASDDRWVVAVVTESGELGQVFNGRADDTLSLPLPDRGTIVQFTIPARHFLDPRGRPLGAEQIAEIRVLPEGTAEAGWGACGRCLAPAVSVEPKPWFPGDRCAIPEGAAGQVLDVNGGALMSREAPEVLRRWAARIHLATPGVCPCPLASLSAGSMPAPRICPLEPERSPVVYDRWDVADDGTAVAFNQGFGLWVGADEIRRTVAIEPASGPVTGVGLNRAGTLSLAAADDLALVVGGTDFFWWDGDSMLESRPEEKSYVMSAIEPLGASALAVMGRLSDSTVSQPHALHCDAGTRRISACLQASVEWAGACPGARDTRFVGMEELDGSEDAIAVTHRGHVFIRRAGEDVWRCDPSSEQRTVDFDSGPVAIDQSLGLTVLGRRVFACFGTTADEVFLQTAEVPPLADVELPVSLTWTTVATFSGDCRGFVRTPDGLGLNLVVSPSRLIELSAAGAVVRDVSPVSIGEAPFTAIPQRVTQVAESAGKMSALAWAGRDVYRRTSPEASFKPLSARDPEDPLFTPAPVGLRGGAVAWLEPPGAVRRAIARGAGCEGVSVERRPVPGLDLAGAVVTAVSGDSRGRDRFFAFVRRDDGATEVLAIDAEQGTLLERRGVFDGGRQVNLATELASGWILLASDDGALWVLSPDSLHELAVDFVDPVTGRDRALFDVAAADRYRTLTSTLGVGWALGVGTMVRVVATDVDAGYRAEGYWVDRLQTASFNRHPRARPSDLGAARAICPDQVVASSKELWFAGDLDLTPDVRLAPWELGPVDAACDSSRRWGFCAYPGSRESASENPGKAAIPRAVVEGPAGVTIVYSDGTLYAPDRPRRVAPFTGELNAAGGDGFFVLTGAGGYVAAGVLP